MARADRDWPARMTIALCEGKYATLVRQLTTLTGGKKELAVRMLLRAMMRSSSETDADAFEEPRHG